MQASKLLHGVARLALLSVLSACGSEESAPEAKTCDAVCRDESAVRALRETIKVVYNLTLQANPVGEQDESTRCPLAGRARVRGVATSLAEQGASELALVYELEDCAYLQRDDEPEENYDTVISGTVVEQGTLAVQPTATTALIFESDSISVVGTVYDPPSDYSEPDCALRLVQDGNKFSGTFCGRKVGFDL
jgi:hypothetical protein